MTNLARTRRTLSADLNVAVARKSSGTLRTAPNKPVGRGRGDGQAPVAS
jgi:hypothetical protein